MNMLRVTLCFTIIIMAINCESLAAKPSEMERRLDMKLDMLEERIKLMDSFIEGVSNEVCSLNSNSLNGCPRYGIQKAMCCFRSTIKYVQETLRVNDDRNKSESKLELNYRVSFSAKLQNSIQNIAPDQTIVFDDVIINEGGGYNTANGIFTAPVEGTYIFFSHILGAPRALETWLLINGVPKLVLYSGDPKYYAPDGNMVVIHMRKGDWAKMAKHEAWGERPFYIHHWFSTFSGFLLHS